MLINMRLNGRSSLFTDKNSLHRHTSCRENHSFQPRELIKIHIRKIFAGKPHNLAVWNSGVALALVSGKVARADGGSYFVVISFLHSSRIEQFFVLCQGRG